MLDDDNSVGLDGDVVFVDDVDAGDSKSSWWAVGVSDNTIDGGEDGLLIDCDGVPERSKYCNNSHYNDDDDLDGK